MWATTDSRPRTPSAPSGNFSPSLASVASRVTVAVEGIAVSGFGRVWGTNGHPWLRIGSRSRDRHRPGRQLRHRPPHRARGDGRGLRGAARAPPRAVRGQAAAARAAGEPGRLRALLPRSGDHVAAAPPEHRPDLRLQRRARRAAPTSSWSTCRARPGGAPARRAAAAARGHAHRRRGRVGAGAGARARRRPPRSQAGEHLPGHRRRPDGRAGQGARLRHLEGPGGGGADLAAPSICSGRPRTWRPSRRAATATRSTAAPISSRWARSPTGC